MHLKSTYTEYRSSLARSSISIKRMELRSGQTHMLVVVRPLDDLHFHRQSLASPHDAATTGGTREPDATANGHVTTECPSSLSNQEPACDC
jgi:hypothetical protein